MIVAVDAMVPPLISGPGLRCGLLGTPEQTASRSG